MTLGCQCHEGGIRWGGNSKQEAISEAIVIIQAQSYRETKDRARGDMFYYALFDWIWIFMVTVTMGPRRKLVMVDVTRWYTLTQRILY